jgi:hypothetical protein
MLVEPADAGDDRRLVDVEPGRSGGRGCPRRSPGRLAPEDACDRDKLPYLLPDGGGSFRFVAVFGPDGSAGYKHRGKNGRVRSKTCSTS